jgi:hypothetical protein
MLSALSFVDTLKSMSRSLRLPPVSSETLSDELIAQTLRRAVHILAPCPAHALARSVRQALGGLDLSDEELEHRIEDVLEALVTYGDILEMRAGGEDPWERPDDCDPRLRPLWFARTGPSYFWVSPAMKSLPCRAGIFAAVEFQNPQCPAIFVAP